MTKRYFTSNHSSINFVTSQEECDAILREKVIDFLIKESKLPKCLTVARALRDTLRPSFTLPKKHSKKPTVNID